MSIKGNIKKYNDFLFEFKEYSKMTDDEYDYFGSFDDDFHGIKNKNNVVPYIK